MFTHTQESPFTLDVNLGVISRLEKISVPNQGENTRGLELVCKVPTASRRSLTLILLAGYSSLFSWNWSISSRLLVSVVDLHPSKTNHLVTLDCNRSGSHFQVKHSSFDFPYWESLILEEIEMNYSSSPTIKQFYWQYLWSFPSRTWGATGLLTRRRRATWTWFRWSPNWPFVCLTTQSVTLQPHYLTSHNSTPIFFPIRTHKKNHRLRSLNQISTKANNVIRKTTLFDHKFKKLMFSSCGNRKIQISFHSDSGDIVTFLFHSHFLPFLVSPSRCLPSSTRRCFLWMDGRCTTPWQSTSGRSVSPLWCSAWSCCCLQSQPTSCL